MNSGFKSFNGIRVMTECEWLSTSWCGQMNFRENQGGKVFFLSRFTGIFALSSHGSATDGDPS